jgi:arylsulfatase
MGRLLDKLGETGRGENTLIMFVSDNGASAEMVHIADDYGDIGSMTLWSSLGENWANVSNTPFRYYKNFSYEGGINTPLIATWPGQIDPGSFSSFPGHFIDIMATCVDVSGAHYPEVFNGEKITPLEGSSLLPSFYGEAENRAEPLFWEWRNGQAVRHQGWKLVKEGLEKDWDLYHLKTDPTETTNLALENPDKVEELELLFREWKVKVGN